jgi:hypothetical protein
MKRLVPPATSMQHGTPFAIVEKDVRPIIVQGACTLTLA